MVKAVLFKCVELLCGSTFKLLASVRGRSLIRLMVTKFWKTLRTFHSRQNRIHLIIGRRPSLRNSAPDLEAFGIELGGGGRLGIMTWKDRELFWQRVEIADFLQMPLSPFFDFDNLLERFSGGLTTISYIFKGYDSSYSLLFVFEAVASFSALAFR